MAPGTLAAPGTEYGPCLEACCHLDCLRARATVESICPDCGQVIGYDRLFYRDGQGYAHAACLEDRP